jgi:hypothetical protein
MRNYELYLLYFFLSLSHLSPWGNKKSPWKEAGVEEGKKKRKRANPFLVPGQERISMSQANQQCFPLPALQ